MKFIIIFFLFMLSGASCATEHTAPQLLQMINEKGANAVVHELYNDDESEWWNHIIPEISKGNNDWLTVASALESGVDASTAEDLQGAVSEAIPHNPVGVLAILSDNRPLLTIEQICAFASFPESEEEMNKLFVNSIREMYKVKTAEGKQCIAVMINTVENSVPFNKDL
ncbi:MULTISPECIES: hypothetical protein [unclassified Citrobacter]|uniref:hypothetical protein n=1 Tax=unclassified Citrobacter TaxID=2644389 RepID=UPI0010CA1253|nr:MULTISPECIES: hypothetical protein [unclassified Citrobacter]MBA7969100.1 hypothetical protein [Citrobacter sp. RHBSTW-00671]TKV07089.1 hypothetical protein FDX19_18435 [Citrobacter sp. wls619]HCJ6374637.1 hypothetical protein [Citrobacter freundii]